MLPLSNNKRLIKVMADFTNKQTILGTMIVSFVIMFIIAMVAGLAIPNSVNEVKGSKACPEDYSYFTSFCKELSLDKNKIWLSYLSNVRRDNIYMSVTGEVILHNQPIQEDIDFDLNYKYTLQPVDIQNLQPDEEILAERSEHKVHIQCYKGRDRCEKVNFLWINNIDHESYKLEIEFMVKPAYLSTVRRIRFSSKMQNSTYTLYLLLLRYTCLGVSLIFSLFYLSFYIQIKSNFRTFEHKYILLLSVLLFFFNDPIYAATMLTGKKGLVITSALSMVFFTAFMLFFWVVMMKRVYTENIRTETKLLNGHNLFALLLALIILGTVAIVDSLIYRYDPSFHLEYEQPLISTIFNICTIVLACLFLIYFAYNSYHIYKKWNSLIPRHKFFCGFSFYFIITIVLAMASGYVHVFENNGIKMLMVFTLMNIYVVVLQVFWRFNSVTDLETLYLEEIGEEDGDKINLERDGLDIFDDKLNVEVFRVNDNSRQNDSVITRGEDEDGRNQWGKRESAEQLMMDNSDEEESAEMTFNNRRTKPKSIAFEEESIEQSSFEIDQGNNEDMSDQDYRQFDDSVEEENGGFNEDK